jgi:hypothetical protein
MPPSLASTHREIRRFDDLASVLAGQVFHVTTTAGYEAILAAGAVEPNTVERASPFGNTRNGFFRLRGCVSVFDYRAYGSPKWQEHAHKCLPTSPLREDRPVVVLFLKEEHHPDLIPWSKWKDEAAWSQRVVPHVEAGYPGSLPLTAIKHVLQVSLVPQ